VAYVEWKSTKWDVIKFHSFKLRTGEEEFNEKQICNVTEQERVFWCDQHKRSKKQDSSCKMVNIDLEQLGSIKYVGSVVNNEHK
jgi:hypothetical protein